MSKNRAHLTGNASQNGSREAYGSVPGAAVPSPAIQTTMAYTQPSDRHSWIGARRTTKPDRRRAVQCSTRSWAVQSSSYAPVAVETRVAAASASSARPVDPATGSPPNSCSCESRARARLSTACRAWSSIACPPAGIAATSDCAASASLMTDFAGVSTHDGLRRVFVGIKDYISFQPACTPS
jgi:hypothetical protein